MCTSSRSVIAYGIVTGAASVAITYFCGTIAVDPGSVFFIIAGFMIRKPAEASKLWIRLTTGASILGAVIYSILTYQLWSGDTISFGSRDSLPTERWYLFTASLISATWLLFNALLIIKDRHTSGREQSDTDGTPAVSADL